MGQKVVRIIITLIGGGLGLWLSRIVLDSSFVNSILPVGSMMEYTLIGLSTGILALLAFALAPWCMRKVVQAAAGVENALQKTPTQDLLGGALGLIIGLIIATLLGYSFSYVPVIGGYLAIIVSLGLGYLGLLLGMKRKDELLAVFSIFPRIGGRDKDRALKSEVRGRYKILDTSVIIDGRIADICQSGFIEGVLVVPSFVLEELRHVADSSDLLKRSRGRRGLDILNEMRKNPNITVEVVEDDFEDLTEVDSKLVRLAQLKQGYILTNDYNLNKVAELQGVKVLNINELANAVKPIVLPGEEMVVQVIKDGKEAGQGVGYLDDGTMIVIDGGRRFIGQSVDVFVTSVFQTAAGRMIFAKPRGTDKKMPGTGTNVNEVNLLG
ncbi:MAG: TRAM domain-containing protein [Syntrophomonadaceae bacterium]|nr:TRAM domain-containing protein [Syntrophomonadaceae bacterium]